MRTLLVHYLPRAGRSRTRRLLEAFRTASGAGHVEMLDLAADPPRAFDATSLPAYVRRNYGGESLSDAESRSLRQADSLTEQLLRSDVVVLAFPMFNFSVPAAVKAWMDAVMQKGRTWTAAGGRYKGLLAGKRALVLMTSGGSYAGERAVWDHAGPMACHAFEFMGFSDVRLDKAEGMNADPAGAAVRLEEAENAARQVAHDWLVPAAVAAP